MLSLNPAKPVQPIGLSRDFRAAAYFHSVASPNRRYYEKCITTQMKNEFRKGIIIPFVFVFSCSILQLMSEHNHSHSHQLTHINRAFLVGIGFNLAFVIIEVIAGITVNSLSLLSDAGHNFADVISLLLSLLAFRLAKIKATEQYTYGFRKTSILVALFNAMILLGSVGAITYEAIHRIFIPEQVQGGYIAMVAGIGIVVNGITALLFFREQTRDLNIRSAYLHMLSDALVSFGIVIGGVIIYYSNWYWVDPLLSLLIVIVIFWSTWGLLKDSLRLSLDGVPRDIDIEEVKRVSLLNPKISSMHHVHIWSLSTMENAMTAHIVLAPKASKQEEYEIKNNLRRQLEHLHITHITLETEIEDTSCTEEECD